MRKPVTVVIGGEGGLGSQIAEQLFHDHGHEVHTLDLKSDFDVTDPKPEQFPARIDNLVNAAGLNEMAWLDEMTTDLWDEVMNVNARGLWQTVQVCLHRLQGSRGTVCNIVSNAAHVPMRTSAAYNASKGAAKILTQQMARELAPNITVFSVSPNKLSGTHMSEAIDRQVCQKRGWTKQQARNYQLKGLLTGEETPVEHCAEFIAFLLSTKERNKHLTGCDIPYGA